MWVALTGTYFPTLFTGFKLYEDIIISINFISGFVLLFIFLRAWKKGSERKALGFSKPKEGKMMFYFLGI
ncbi:MAG: hypothetical protein ACOC4M_09920 [Promethearchaeia archaeon]